MQKITLSFIAIVTLSACGGSGVNPIDSDPPTSVFGITVEDPDTAGNIQFHTLADGNGTIYSGDGSLDLSAKRLETAFLSGNVDFENRQIVFDNGGTATLMDAQTVHVGPFVGQPKSDSPLLGVIGAPTELSNLPTGSTATFQGNDSAHVQITDLENSYDLTGTVTVDLRLDDGKVDFTFSDLNGTQNVFDTVNDVATIKILSATFQDGIFAGGEATVSSSKLTSALTSNADTNVSGGIFGPNGKEAAGVFAVDDDEDNGGLLIQGVFTAN